MFCVTGILTSFDAKLFFLYALTYFLTHEKYQQTLQKRSVTQQEWKSLHYKGLSYFRSERFKSDTRTRKV